MNDVQEGVTLEGVLESPPAEGGEATPEVKAPEQKPEEAPVPYERFKEVNEQLKTVRSEIDSLRAKSEIHPLSEEEKKELQAAEFIGKIVQEKVIRMQQEEERAETARESQIEEEIKFYNSVDKEFTEKAAEEIGERYGTEKNPISIETTYKIFQNEKQLKSQLPGAPKPKVPNPLQSQEAAPATIPEEDKTRSFRDVVEDVKRSLRGK